jgi:hypothetical protein
MGIIKVIAWLWRFEQSRPIIIAIIEAIWTWIGLEKWIFKTIIRISRITCFRKITILIRTGRLF